MQTIERFVLMPGVKQAVDVALIFVSLELLLHIGSCLTTAVWVEPSNHQE